MKKKILALILAFTLIFATVPSFAGVGGLSSLKKADNPLTVTYGLDGMNYASLGDSVAYGFGLEGSPSYNDLMTYANNVYNKQISGAYPILLKNLFKCSNETFFQGAICAARQQELCYFIDNSSVELDSYYNLSIRFLPKDSNDNAKVSELSAAYKEAVTEADFITIAAGGNTMMTASTIFDNNWGKPGQAVELERYYGEAAAKTFYAVKNSVLKTAIALDKKSGDTVAINDATYPEDTYTYKVENTFDNIETKLYLLAQNSSDTELLLDTIHKTNPDAVVAYLGMPYAFADYDVKIGPILIDLEKVMVPLINSFNLSLKNAAEERSSYVRYIDISDVDLLTSDGLDSTIDYDDMSDILADHPEVTHPSAKGHQQIAARILQNFEFKAIGENYNKTKNFVKNIETMIKSKIGVLKIQNLMSVVNSIDLSGLIKIDWFGWLKKIVS